MQVLTTNGAVHDHDRQGDTLNEFLRMKRMPFECDLELTHDCNQNCIHCYLECPHPGIYADVEMINEALAQLADMGCVRVGFTGGEPMLHPEFWSLLSEARRLGFAVDISTNGTLLDRNSIERLAQLKVKSVRISLLGGCAETHDSIAGNLGAFRLVMAATKAVVRSGIRAEFGCVLLHENCHETLEIERLADSVGAGVIFDSLPVPSLCGRFDPRAHAITPEQFRKYVLPFTGKQSLHHEGCLAGISQLAITPAGEILPCVILREIAGMINDGGLSSIWYGSPTLVGLGSRKNSTPNPAGTRHKRGSQRSCPGREWLWLRTDPRPLSSS